MNKIELKCEIWKLLRFCYGRPCTYFDWLGKILHTSVCKLAQF